MNAIAPVLRRLGADDFTASMALLQYSFQFELEEHVRARWERNFAGLRLWGIFEGRELRSQLCVLDFDIALNGRLHPAGGITRVSSAPESRRGGNVARLIAQALQHLREDGRAIALLVPFAFGFYRRFGWEIVSDYLDVRTETARLPQAAPGGGRIVREAPSPEAALAIHRAHAGHRNGAIARTPWWWNEVVRPRRGRLAATWLGADGRPAGYVLYDFRIPPADLSYQQIRGPREIVVHELAFVDDEARLGLLAFLRAHDSMAETVSLTLAADDPFAFALADPAVSQRKVPYIMGRIVDAGRFLADFRFSPGAGTTLLLDIADPLADWNHGLWRLEIDAAGNARAARIAAADAPAGVARLALDIGALSALLTGYQPAATLAAIGRIAGEAAGIAALAARVPAATPYIPEFF